LAVAFIVMVTGPGPQEKVMTPPAAIPETTACEVQLAAVPLPITRVGCDVSTARASAGTGAWPAGLPAVSRPAGGAAADLVGLGLGDTVGDPALGAVDRASPPLTAGDGFPAACQADPAGDEHPDWTATMTETTTSAIAPHLTRTGR
jgi:hypothetical protein